MRPPKSFLFFIIILESGTVLTSDRDHTRYISSSTIDGRPTDEIHVASIWKRAENSQWRLSGDWAKLECSSWVYPGRGASQLVKVSLMKNKADPTLANWISSRILLMIANHYKVWIGSLAGSRFDLLVRAPLYNSWRIAREPAMRISKEN